MLRPPEVTQGPSPVVQQSPAPYAPVQDTGTGTIDTMITSIMPLVILMMIMGMMMPMMKGMSGGNGK